MVTFHILEQPYGAFPRVFVFKLYQQVRVTVFVVVGNGDAAVLYLLVPFVVLECRDNFCQCGIFFHGESAVTVVDGQKQSSFGFECPTHVDARIDEIHQAVLVEVESLVANATVGEWKTCAAVTVSDVPCAVTVVERKGEVIVPLPCPNHFSFLVHFRSGAPFIGLSRCP